MLSRLAARSLCHGPSDDAVSRDHRRATPPALPHLGLHCAAPPGCTALHGAFLLPGQQVSLALTRTWCALCSSTGLHCTPQRSHSASLSQAQLPPPTPMRDDQHDRAALHSTANASSFLFTIVIMVRGMQQDRAALHSVTDASAASRPQVSSRDHHLVTRGVRTLLQQLLQGAAR